MSKIVLATINAKWIHPSLALRLLKANLGDLSESCEILEFALRQPISEKLTPILAAQPRILGLSVSIWNHLATLELLKKLHTSWRQDGTQWGQKPVVVLGGPEVSWLPDDAEIFRYANYVIRGEGEKSFSTLCNRILNNQEHSEPAGGKIECIQQGDTTVNTALIKTAYHLYTDDDLHKKLVYVEASRGCPFNCEFCTGPARHKTGKERVREFPLEAFLADMEKLIQRGGRTFKFLDRTFNLDIERAKTIMEFFLERFNTLDPVKCCVHFEMVPSRFPPALKEIIRRFPPGTLRLELGFQTCNPQTRELVHISGNIDEELEVLEFLRRETNVIVHADLIAGLPGESFDSFGSGFDRVWQVLQQGEQKEGAIFEIQLGILKNLPGTPLHQHNEHYGMRYSPEPPYEVISTKTLTAGELERIKNFARFWELIVNRYTFPDLVTRLFPPGENVFEKFMFLADRLQKHFGRNWGIDQKELRLYIETLH